MSSWDVLSGATTVPAGPIVLLDDVGHMEGMGVAQLLVSRGHDVTVVTRFTELASQIQPRGRPGVRRSSWHERTFGCSAGHSSAASAKVR